MHSEIIKMFAKSKPGKKLQTYNFIGCSTFLLFMGLCFGEFYGFSHEFRQEEMTANKAYNANKDKERKKNYND